MFVVALFVGLGLGALVVVMTDNRDAHYAFVGICVVLGFVGLRMSTRISMAKFLRQYLAMAPILLAALIGYIFDNSWAGWVILILSAAGIIILVADMWRFKRQSDP